MTSTTQLGFDLNLSRCSGCMACVVACFDQNDISKIGPSFRHVPQIEIGAYPDAIIRYVSLSCMHCGEAPCIIVCPVGAIKKINENGVVVVDQTACIGCHACFTACPFGAPSFPDGIAMSKCDLCVTRVSQGLEPACVRTCPTKALQFGPMEKLAANKAKRISKRIVCSFEERLAL